MKTADSNAIGHTPIRCLCARLRGRVRGDAQKCTIGVNVVEVQSILPVGSAKQSSLYKYEKHFQKMQRDVGMAVPKITDIRCRDGSVQARQVIKRLHKQPHLYILFLLL